MLVHIKKIVSHAQKNKYALGAFNVCDLETAQAVIDAAQKLNSPAILQITQSTIEYAGLANMAGLLKLLASNSAVKIPLALHLDHGKNLKIIKDCIALGFSSIHFDGSELSYAKNVKLTQQVVKYAHARNVWVQGELGRIIGKKDINQKHTKNLNQFFTDPEQAKKFIAQTKINTFAPSVGAMHGMFKGQEKVDVSLLTRIQKNVNLPLVLHGASGVPDRDIRQAIQHGVRIINIDTALRKAFSQQLRHTLQKSTTEIDPRKILSPARQAVSQEVAKKIKLFGSANKY